MSAVEVLGPEGAEEENVEAGGDRKALEQAEAVGVGPVEVFEDDHRRGAAGQGTLRAPRRPSSSSSEA